MSLCICAAAGADQLLFLAAVAGRAGFVELLGCVRGMAILFSADAAGVWEQSNRVALCTVTGCAALEMAALHKRSSLTGSAQMSTLPCSQPLIQNQRRRHVSKAVSEAMLIVAHILFTSLSHARLVL